MKKLLYTLFILIITTALAGCAAEKQPDLELRSYVYERGPLSYASILLKEDDQFIFNYSGLSSHVPMGDYEIEDGYLMLNTKNREEQYVFQIKKGTLIFNAERSTPIPAFANLPDGSVFR